MSDHEAYVDSSSEDDDVLAQSIHFPIVDTSPRPYLPRNRTSCSLSAVERQSRKTMKPEASQATERTSLLTAPGVHDTRYTEILPKTPKETLRSRSRQLSRVQSLADGTFHAGLSRNTSQIWGMSLPTSPMFSRTGLRTPKVNQSMLNSEYADERVWYDQFTSTDWVHDSIADGYRVLKLRRLKGFRGRLEVFYDAAQGWILVAIIGMLVAGVAYFVDVSESAIFDFKRGYCQDSWHPWSDVLQHPSLSNTFVNYIIFTCWCMALAGASCFITLYSKTVVPSHIATTFDENLGAIQDNLKKEDDVDVEPLTSQDIIPANIYYSAAGSGVAEVKVILSGFVLHGYLGLRTLLLKIVALILSVASGMSLGKEGPFVHIATCIGNIACRLFSKYNLNDGKRREVLSASASSGVAVAFGSPLGGVLFGLEEVSYYFPPKTLFRTFFCCIAAALSLKALNPYGTNKIVLFEVRYVTDWRFFELFCFAFLGCAGGVAGALFIKASRLWATTFRRIPMVKASPMLEVLLVALITGLISFWNRYTRLPVAELLAELASPCTKGSITGLCPAAEDIPSVIGYLAMAFVIKSFLTIITFGIKVPAGIYVPSMVVGGLMGRIVGHTVQYAVYQFPNSWIFGHCSNSSSANIEECVTPGVYALVAAGATMCGVTRLSVTLAVILFELTGSLDHVLPFSLAVLFAKWTADAVEPLSIYDLLTEMNSYPFLDNRASPVFDTELGDIAPPMRREKLIDITLSPLVNAGELRTKLARLKNSGELDGGLPIVRDKILVGLIPAPDLEFALDRITTPEQETLCLVSNSSHPNNPYHHGWPVYDEDDDNPSPVSSTEEVDVPVRDPVDLTSYVDPAPVALDVHSPMDLVYQCFAKLGLRYVCVTADGEYRGMVHKKVFVRYVKNSEEKS